MKKVSEVFKLPLEVMVEAFLGESPDFPDNKTYYLKDASGKRILEFLPKDIAYQYAEILNTYDRLKEERDEAVELLNRANKEIDNLYDFAGEPSTLGWHSFHEYTFDCDNFLSRVRKNSTTVSGDDTDEEE